jgi:hypothetical protein
MSSVSEQIHAYQALKTEQGLTEAAVTEADLQSGTGPTPSEFFHNLMQRWHMNYVKNLITRQQRRPE